jgi:hypothetical protein
VLTNPISQNLKPTLKVTGYNFPKHTHFVYAWTTAGAGADGATLEGVGKKSITLDMYSMQTGATVDVVATITNDQSQTAWCDIQIQKVPH